MSPVHPPPSRWFHNMSEKYRINYRDTLINTSLTLDERYALQKPRLCLSNQALKEFRLGSSPSVSDFVCSSWRSCLQSRQSTHLPDSKKKKLALFCRNNWNHPLFNLKFNCTTEDETTWEKLFKYLFFFYRD